MGDSVDLFGDKIEGRGKHYPMVVLTNKKLLLDDTFADMTIQVGNEKVYAHSCIVACRCEEILPMPSDSDKKKNKKVKKDIKEKNIPSALIMQKVLEFLYTGMVDFPKLQTLETLQLNAAARHFKLNRLGYLCERWLREHMTMDNVFHLIKGAVDAKETRVKGFCLQYALDHYNEFIANKDGLHILGIDLFQEVVSAYNNRPPAPEEIPPSKAPPDTLLEDFKRMYSLMPFSDVQFLVGNDYIKCHKAILAAHSDAFVSLVKDAPAGGVELKGLSTQAFTTMLRFIYYGEDTVESKPACELVGFSRQFKLHSLLGICEDKIRNNIDQDTVLAILATTYLREMDDKGDLKNELRAKTFPYIVQNLTTLNLAPIRKMHPNIAYDILMKIQESWDGVGGSGGSGGTSVGSSNMSTTSNDDIAPPPPPRSVPTNASSNDIAPPPPPRSVSNATVPAAVDLPPPVALPPPTTAPPPLSTVPEPVSPTENGSDGRKSARGANKKPIKEDKKKNAKDAEKRKKEEDRRHKEEQKRLKKEREKLEKKSKTKKDATKNKDF